MATDLKTKIKSDLWRVNYVLPFSTKRLQEGLVPFACESARKMISMRVVEGTNPRNIASDTYALMQEIELCIPEDTSYFYWIDDQKTIAVPGNVLSNFSIDYHKVVNEAFDEYAYSAIGVGGAYGQRSKIVKDAIHLLRDRCAATIRSSSLEQERKEQMLDDFSDLLEKPARSFHGALQRVLFFNQALWQTRHRLCGLGRLDKVLARAYECDIQTDTIDRQRAEEYIQDFMRVLHRWYDFKSSGLVGDIGQIIVLGGLEPSGEYFCNDLTTMFMEAHSRTNIPDPKVLLRVSSKMSLEVLECATDALSTSTGSPLFSNDDVVVPRLEDFGVPKEDATNYCVSACWEPFIPGKSFDQNNIKTFDLFRPLSAFLDTKEAANAKNLDDLLSGYERELSRSWIEFMGILDQFSWACDPLVSMLTDGCTQKGVDISGGGACYSNYGITTVGIQSVCDTLANIQVLVYERGLYSIEELNDARIKNFKDRPDIRACLKSQPNRFGADDDLGVQITNAVIAMCNRMVKDYRNPLGGCLKFGLSSPDYIKQSRKAPADLAGRNYGEPYVVHISNPRATYPEIVRFAARLDYGGHAFNGNVVDFFVSPTLIREHKQEFTQFLRGSIVAGFFQMQMNVMDSATLIAARSNPEAYPGLIVRVWGFSAYFNDLPVSYKDYLIQRALESEAVGN